MKLIHKISHFVLFVALASGCAAMAAQQKTVDTARGASYSLPPKTVYSETLALLSATYKIAKESETRGFIETDWKEDKDYEGVATRTKVEAEILGQGNMRVVLRVTVERDVDGEWTQAEGNAAVEDDLYVELHKRLGAQSQAAPAATPPS